MGKLRDRVWRDQRSAVRQCFICLRYGLQLLERGERRFNKPALPFLAFDDADQFATGVERRAERCADGLRLIECAGACRRALTAAFSRRDECVG